MKSPYLNARRAAEYIGYEPQSSSSSDPQMRAFYEFARSKDIPTTKRGRNNLYTEADLESALTKPSAPALVVDERKSDIQQLATMHGLGIPLNMRSRRAAKKR